MVALPTASLVKSILFNTTSLVYPTHTYTYTDPETYNGAWSPHHSSASIPGHSHIGHPRGGGETDSVLFHTDAFKQPTLTRTGGSIIGTYHPQFAGSDSSPACTYSFSFACQAKDDVYRPTQIYSKTHSKYTLHVINPEHAYGTTLLSGTRSLLHLADPGIFYTTAHPDSFSRRAEDFDNPNPLLCT